MKASKGVVREQGLGRYDLLAVRLGSYMFEKLNAMKKATIAPKDNSSNATKLHIRSQ